MQTTLATIEAIDDDNVSAARALTLAILRDAALTAQLMRHANASGRAGQSVSTVDQAIAILGMNKVRSVAAALPAIGTSDAVTGTSHTEHLQAELVSAAFCGLFASGLTRMNAPRLKPQETAVCGLLQNLGRMLAGYYLYDDIVRSHVLQAEQNLSEDEAVTRTFGVSFDDIGAAVAQHWKFPDVLQKSLDGGLDKVPARPLASPLEWHQYCAGFARRVTDALFRLPEHQMKGAVATEITAYRTMLHLKDTEVTELIDGTLAELDASLAASGNPCSASRARDLLRKSSDRVTDWLSPQDSLTKSSVDDVRKTRVEVIYQLLRSIHDAFHFDMTLLCVPNGSTELVAISGVGRNANQIISRFRCGGAKADLFRSVAAKSIGLYVADIHGGPYAKFIPHWYENLVGARSLYLMSLMHDGEPLGLVYGDFTVRTDVAPDGLDGLEMRQWRNALIAALRPAGGKS
ncbi:MAG: HDOD domain-containing protein [Herminiimonas sp.]|nr:HDOD domain-containing protein [Herminiimonas sp.]